MLTRSHLIFFRKINEQGQDGKYNFVETLKPKDSGIRNESFHTNYL